jgi:hypothetical protein
VVERLVARAHGEATAAERAHDPAREAHGRGVALDAVERAAQVVERGLRIGDGDERVERADREAASAQRGETLRRERAARVQRDARRATRA